jgi:ribosomal protein S12 methylthiotransferase
VDQGALELNLIAEDTNQWGQDIRSKDGRGLAHLLRELSTIPNLKWLRILYAYPSYFDEDLIQEIATNSKVCKYIDMPLQHISNLTLLAMNRPPQAHTVSLLTKLRDNIPNLALRTTFISGFPGESEENHRELVNFVEEFKFQRMGCFAYSEEDGTPAATYPEQLAPEVKEARRDELISLQQRIGEEWAKEMVGRECDVLIDGYTEDGDLYGRTEWDAPDIDNIVFIGEPQDEGVAAAEVGEMRRCMVVGNSIFDLEAYPIA